MWLTLAAIVIILALAGALAWVAKKKGAADAAYDGWKAHQKIDLGLSRPIPLGSRLRVAMRARLRRMQDRLR